MDMKAINAQREDSSQSHHAAHRSHVVKVGLRVLDVPEANRFIYIISRDMANNRLTATIVKLAHSVQRQIHSPVL